MTVSGNLGVTEVVLIPGYNSPFLEMSQKYNNFKIPICICFEFHILINQIATLLHSQNVCENQLDAKSFERKVQSY